MNIFDKLMIRGLHKFFNLGQLAGAQLAALSKLEVDTVTEKLIQEALERLMEGRTSFMIAHRLSTIRHASQILVLKSGKVVEQGGHDELVARGGVYARLTQIQNTFSVEARFEQLSDC